MSIDWHIDYLYDINWDLRTAEEIWDEQLKQKPTEVNTKKLITCLERARTRIDDLINELS